MQEEKSLSKLIESSDSLAIVVNNISVISTAYGVSALVQVIKDLNKLVCVVCPKKVSFESQKILNEYGITVEKKILPAEYLVKIDYGKNQVEKIEYDTNKEEGKLIFKIYPSGNGFDFENVEFVQGGNKFDGCIQIDEVENQDEFREVVVYKTNSNGLCESLIREQIFETSDNATDILSKGLSFGIDSIESLDDDGWEIVSDLVKKGVNVGKIIKDKGLSKSSNFVNLNIRLMQNVVMDKENKCIWSFVTEKDIKYCGVESKELDSFGKIPFNISSEFDLAFAFYELEKEKIKVVIESNNDGYSASVISGVFKGVGNSVRSTAFLPFGINGLKNGFWEIINDLYSLNISKSNPIIVDNLNKALTKSRKNSKNRG